MKVGYASLTYGVPETKLRTCTAKNATPEKLEELIGQNLAALEKIVDYNIQNQILFFRISSSLIPFASSPVNQLKWWDLFQEEFEKIASKIQASGMRVTMHPGQYTVLNSPDEEIVARTVEDLVYHDRLLSSLGAGKDGKIILHIGGVYGDKQAAMARFAANYRLLPRSIKDRLIIENDDISYTIEEVLELSGQTGAPVVYDNLHNRLNASDPSKSDAYWITKAGQTWSNDDGKQKIHYSQQAPDRRAGGHSRTIHLNEFQLFYQSLPYDLDIMLEVKDKNLSALKVLHYIEPERGMKGLEKEWARYKYAVLEHSPVRYQDIRTLLKNKSSYPVLEFYQLIDDALETEKETGKTRNTLDHVWGYFKNRATEKEKKKYENYLARFERGTLSAAAVKNLLWSFAEKYEETYLLQSYFFFM